MNKYILVSSIIFSIPSLFAQQQLGNGNMEDWQNVGSSTEEPNNWNSFKTGVGGVAWLFGSTTIQRSTAIRAGATGSYCSRIWTKEPISNVYANGNMTLGKINMGSSTAADETNYNYTQTSDANFSEAITDSPDSLVFWCKYTNGNANSLARVSAVLHNTYDYRDGWVVDANSAPHKVAEISYNYPSTNGEWVRKSVPWNYTGPASAHTYILITFATNNIPGGGNNNDEVLIDDIELIYNQAPTATDDDVTTFQDTPIDVTVLSNDTDPEGSFDISSVAIITQPTNGSVVVNIDGTVTYTPNAGYFGSDSFTYEVCDIAVVSRCDQAVVNVTVNEAGTGNNAIVANDDYVYVFQDSPTAYDVVLNDIDFENQIDLSSLTIVTQPSNGIAVANTLTGEITYTPDAGFLGMDSYTYSICDLGAPITCDEATVDVNVYFSNIDELYNSNVNVSYNTGHIIISSEEVLIGEYKVITSAGEVIQLGTIESQIALNAPVGIYFIQLSTVNGMITKKFIKF